MNNNLKILKSIFSSETIRKFNSKAKKTYKLALCGIVADAFHYGNYAQGVHFGTARTWSLNPELVNKRGPGKFHQTIVFNLASYYFYDLDDNEYVDKVISFFRNYLNDLEKKNKRFYLLSEIKEIYNFEQYLLDKANIPLKDHHWLDINLHEPVTPTYPEFYNYMDLMNLWNDFVSKNIEFKKMISEKNTGIPRFRELNSSASSSTRAVVISAVMYVESYLYYYYYNIKHDKVMKNDERVIGIFNRKGNIQDKQIVEDVIFVLHPEIKTNQHIKELYGKYKSTLKIRDRFVHISAFVDKSNQMSELQPLFSLTEEELEGMLQNCVDLTYMLDELLPENEKILFWWDRFETPVFKSDKKVNTLNINS